MANILLGCPTFDGSIDIGTSQAFHATATRQHRCGVLPMTSSLLTHNCNQLLAEALNLHQSNQIEWLAMLHADIEPEKWWLDKLIAEAEKHRADLLSAVVPVKNVTGQTTTAIADPAREFGCLFRLTQAQVRHPAFPDTFGIEEAAEALEGLPIDLRVIEVPRRALLVNTGCMVYRLSQWRPGVKFANHDDVIQHNGKHQAVTFSEDWMFSKLVADHGGKVMATRLIELRHWGKRCFDSHSVWGQSRDIVSV